MRDYYWTDGIVHEVDALEGLNIYKITYKFTADGTQTHLIGKEVIHKYRMLYIFLINNK